MSWHDTAPDRTGVGRLQGDIDEVFADGDGSEEFLGCQPTEVRTLSEVAQFRTELILRQTGQRVMVELEWNTATIDGLLVDTDRHLRDVEEVTLAPPSA